MKHPIKALAFLFAFFSTVAFAQPEPTLSSSAQNSEPTFSPDGVWHKNMELICPVPLPNQPWGEHSQAVTINGKKFFLSTHGADGLRLTDVTNPRSVSVALTITADFKNDDDDDNDLDAFPVEFKTNEVWAENHDEITGELNGHVFAIVEVGWSPDENTHIRHITVTRDVDNKTVLKARLLIIDLTEALDLISSPGGGGTTSIHINDVVDRNSAHRVGVTENSHMVHIGYIPTDATTVKDRDNNNVPTIDRVHTLSLERNIGMLVINPVNTRKVPSGVVAGEFAGFIDLFDLSVLVDHTDANSTTILMEPDRIMSNGLPIIVKTTPNVINTAPIAAHETDIHRTRELMDGMPTSTFIPGKVDVAVAGFARNTRHLGDAVAEQSPGGAVIMEIDFSSSKTNAVCSLIQHWQYDPDRESPSSKTSSNANWSWRAVHSVDGLHFDHHNHLYLTTEEIASPQFKPGTTSLWTRTDVTNGNYFSDFTQPLHFENVTSFNDPTEDHRRLGAYMRIWLSSMDHRKIEGSGSNNSAQASGGPCGSYDIPEQSPTDRANELRNPALGNDEITRVDCSTSDNERAPNTTHHIRTMYGSLGRLPESSSETDEFSLRTEAYVAAYSQGVRVIDMKDFIDPDMGFNDGDLPNPVADVIERAYFDFIPTLNYDPDSRYFYANAPGGASNFYDGQLAIENYFTGPIDAYPDMPITGRPTGIQPDENFLYTYGFVGKQGPWLQTGGFLILRYFRDKLGGTITGYSGTNAQNDMAFRDVNLQGIFEVSRDVTVATGATVNLLKDTKLNPDASPGERLIIDGTVNVQTLAAEFTSTTGRGVIDVPVLVRNGGKLVVKAGAVVDFKKMVTVDAGGELRIEEDTKVVFGAPKNICNGKLYILGTAPYHRALIRATLNSNSPARTETVGNSSIIMRGQPEPPSITPDFSTNYLQIQYADFENVYLQSTDIKMHYPYAIYYSDFSGKDSPHNYLPLVSLWFRAPTTTVANSIHSKVHVNKCTFTDRAGKKADPGLYDINGLDISGYKIMSVRGSSFKFLKNAMHLNNCGSSLIMDNTIDGEFTGGEIGVYSTSDVGVLSSDILPRFCSNTFKDNYIATQGSSNMTSKFFDNDYIRSYVASGSISNHDLFYRGNTYNEYCLGIASLGPVMNNLRSFWWPTNANPSDYGKNVFIIPEDRDDRWGCLPTDVLLNQKSDMRVNCGFNTFSVNSKWHIGADASSKALHDPILGKTPLDISNNKWQKPGGHQVRSSIQFMGAPINQAQSSFENCGDNSISPFDHCPMPANTSPVTQLPMKDTMDMGAVLSKYDSLWSNIADTSLLEAWRISAAKHAYELSVVLDSVAIYDNNVSDFGAIANNTSLPIDLRVTARALKGMSYERLGKRDSAILEYYQITQTSTALQADSLAAAWRMQYNYALANTANRDSAVRKYVDRVINDLHRIWDNSVAYKMASNSPLDEEESQANTMGINLEQNIPNPFEESTEISYTLPNEGFVHIVIIDVLGNEVRTLINGEGKAGRNVVSFRASDIPDGIYFYRLQFGNQVITKKMQKSN